MAEFDETAECAKINNVNEVENKDFYDIKNCVESVEREVPNVSTKSKFHIPGAKTLRKVFSNRARLISKSVSGDTCLVSPEGKHDSKRSVFDSSTPGFSKSNSENTCKSDSSCKLPIENELGIPKHTKLIEKTHMFPLKHLRKKASSYSSSLDKKAFPCSRSYNSLPPSYVRKTSIGPRYNSFTSRRADSFIKSVHSVDKSSTISSTMDEISKDVPLVLVSTDKSHPEIENPDLEQILKNLEGSADLEESKDHTSSVEHTKVSEGIVSETGSNSQNSGSSKSSNINKNGSFNSEEFGEFKQPSLESEQGANSSFTEDISPANSFDIPVDKQSESKLRKLRKFTIGFHGKEKKSQTQDSDILPEFKLSLEGDDISTKDEEIALKNVIKHSSEESINSIPEKGLRRGKFLEISQRIIRKSSDEHLSVEMLPDSSSSQSLTSKPSKSFGEKVAEYLQRGGSRLQEQQRRLKSQIWSSVVTIILVEGKHLPASSQSGAANPYVKFRLGNEKYKSKVEMKTQNPRWLEQFDFHLFEDQSHLLEISVCEKDPRWKDDFVGKCSIDLRQYEKENTHKIWVDLEDDEDSDLAHNGKLHLLVTISGTTSSASISDLMTYKENPHELKVIKERYHWTRTCHNIRDVGLLTVKVFKAQGLAAADFGVGKSDPFCVLELVNARLQTQTEYKTLSPCWNKIFTFDVKDIHSVLEVTVYDEDRDHKVDFLGKVVIPLLKIENGEKKWYCLKDKKLRVRAKGQNPEILLECSIYWNAFRAAFQTIEPKEEKYMHVDNKFKRYVFVRNVNRVKAAVMDIVDIGIYIKSCFEWESTPRSVSAFVGFMFVTYYFEAYMAPAALLLLFVKNYVVMSIVGSKYPKDEEQDPSSIEDDIDEEEKEKLPRLLKQPATSLLNLPNVEDPRYAAVHLAYREFGQRAPAYDEEKKTLKERLVAIQEVIASVQNTIGEIASYSESIINTFNFSVPFLSWLMILFLIVATVVLYYVPIRALIMFWGINKFTRKLIRPNSIVTNEIVDYLSRVPDDEGQRDSRELRPLYPQSSEEKKREAKKRRA